MEQFPNSENQKPKIIDEDLDQERRDISENIEFNKSILGMNLKLLKDWIDSLKQSEKWIKEMINFSKENQEHDEFLKQYGQEPIFNKHSYTVGDVEKELENIEKIKARIEEVREEIMNDRQDIKHQEENLKELEKLEREFRDIMTSIDPNQLN